MTMNYLEMRHEGNRLVNDEVVVSVYRNSNIDTIREEVESRYPGLEIKIVTTRVDPEGKLCLSLPGERGRYFTRDYEGRFDVLSILRSSRKMSTS